MYRIREKCRVSVARSMALSAFPVYLLVVESRVMSHQLDAPWTASGTPFVVEGTDLRDMTR